MTQIFGCPFCKQSFQVPAGSGGQSFQCPSCQKAVEVPAEKEKPIVFGCPECRQGFGVTRDMEGEELGCPHCNALVTVSFAAIDAQADVDEVGAKEAPETLEPSTEPIFEAEDTETEPEIEADEALSEADDEPKSKKGFFSFFGRRKTASEENADSLVAEKQEGMDQVDETPPEADSEESDDEPEAETEPEPEAFQPKPIDHLLPPKFEVPDPVRFPSRKDGKVLLPDGQGGYQSADPGIVTITHKGQVYHLQKMTPQQRSRRRIIHNSIAILVAVLLIWLTLDALGIDLLE